jgi:hypothetical protein
MGSVTCGVGGFARVDLHLWYTCKLKTSLHFIAKDACRKYDLLNSLCMCLLLNWMNLVLRKFNRPKRWAIRHC